MAPDKVIGWSLVGLSSASLVFYTVWVVLLPFVDEEQVIHQYFPDRYYTVTLPLLAGVIGLAVIERPATVRYHRGRKVIIKAHDLKIRPEY